MPCFAAMFDDILAIHRDKPVGICRDPRDIIGYGPIGAARVVAQLADEARPPLTAHGAARSMIWTGGRCFAQGGDAATPTMRRLSEMEGPAAPCWRGEAGTGMIGG